MAIIYKATSKTTLESYIGQTINTLKVRKGAHLLFAKHSPMATKFTKAINKYGKKDFEWSILEECSEDKLTEREGYWSEIYDSVNNGYNTLIPGQDSMKGENNPRYGKNDHCYGLVNFNSNRKGKTWEESYGEELAVEMRKEKSEKNSGNKNPMAGRTPHDCWIEKYGIEAANKKQQSMINHRRETTLKNGSQKGSNNPYFKTVNEHLIHILTSLYGQGFTAYKLNKMYPEIGYYKIGQIISGEYFDKVNLA